MKKLWDTLRSRGGVLTIIGVICGLVGPSISTTATDSNAALEVVGVVIWLAGYLMIAVGLVMIVAARRGPKKT